MILDIFEPEFIVPMLILSVPIIAIVGGIVAGIVRTMGQQRLLELAQRERIAAIERGVDLSKLPPLAGTGLADLGGLYGTATDQARRRAAALRTSGIITIAIGLSVAVFLRFVLGDRTGTEARIWTIGFIPLIVGVALLIAAALDNPKN